MSLQKMIEEIKQIRPFAEEDTSQGPLETLNARRGRKNQAIERLKQIKASYSKELLRTAVFIVSAGSGRDEFQKIASEQFGIFTADPMEFYADLAGRVPASLYLGKESISNLFEVIGRHLEDKMNELDINEYNQLIFKAEFAGKINNPSEFENLVRRAINKQIGAEIAGIQAIQSILGSAIEREHTDKITPIVLNAESEELALELMKDLERITAKTFLVNSGKSTKTLRAVEGALSAQISESEDSADKNTESVKQVLTTIKKEIKSK